MYRERLHTLCSELLAFLRYLGARIVEDRCQQSAAALTFVTLFAMVPMLTVFYAILSSVPAFTTLGAQAESFVFRHFVPATGAEVQQHLGNFTEQARRLTLPGMVMLVAAAYLMLKNLEKQLNHIWRVREHRRGIANFLLYWAVLSLGPMLIGAGLLISTYLFSLAIFELPETAQLRSWIILLLPQLFSFATFTLMYSAIPNCRVPLLHAAAGGLVGTVLFELSKLGFAAIVLHGSFTLIYGAFAAVPLFLVWVNLSWLIVLGGAEFVHALSHYRNTREPRLPDVLSALALMHRLHCLHQQGASLREEDVLATGGLSGAGAADADRWQALRDRLLAARYMRETRQNEYVLGIDTSSVSLWSLCVLVGVVRPVELASTAPAGLSPWLLAASERIRNAGHNMQQDLGASLEQVFNAIDGNDGHDQ
jgi:membrane protein